MRLLALALIMVVTGCVFSRRTADAGSPYAPYLPQALPSEANRVEIPGTGCSIVSPEGWTVYKRPIENVTNGDGVMIIIVCKGQYETEISIQRLKPREYALYHCHEWLHSNQTPGQGWRHTQFQGQSALSLFRVGKVEVGTDEIELDQFLYFERGGNEFILRFSTGSIGGKLDYTCPIPIIERYFETFRYDESKQVMPNTTLEPHADCPLSL